MQCKCKPVERLLLADMERLERSSREQATTATHTNSLLVGSALDKNIGTIVCKCCKNYLYHEGKLINQIFRSQKQINNKKIDIYLCVDCIAVYLSDIEIKEYKRVCKKTHSLISESMIKSIRQIFDEVQSDFCKNTGWKEVEEVAERTTNGHVVMHQDAGCSVVAVIWLDTSVGEKGPFGVGVAVHRPCRV
jgi:hypothetical protein